jgi:molecular chaperone GrpE
MKKKHTKKTALEEKLEEEQGPRYEAAQAAEAAPNADGDAIEVSVEDGEAEASREEPAAESDAALQAAEKERDELKDQLLRARAEFDNYRKRTARENERIRKTAAESLVRDLLPVIDHLELALNHADQASQAVVQGVEMVARQFSEVLSRHGVEPILAAGEPFDPNVHEAMMQRPDDEAEANTVLEEFQRGYRMGDLVLRPSKVVVCSGPETTQEDETGADSAGEA